MLAIRCARLPQYGTLQIALRAQTLQNHASTISFRTLKTSPSILPYTSQPQATTPYAHRQTRWASSDESRSKQRIPDDVTVLEILRRGMDFSYLKGGFNFRKLNREHPVIMFLWYIGTAVIVCMVIPYAVYRYHKLYNPWWKQFPDDVAVSLRRAIHFSTEKVKPDQAIRYWEQALERCNAHNMDPYSEQVVGIKIRAAEFLETKLYDIPQAVKVLEVILDGHKRWLEICEEDPLELPWGHIPGRKIMRGDKEHVLTEEEWQQWYWYARNRTLGKAAQISIKLGELYAHEQMRDMDKSHEHLVWGVETSLRESRRRTVEGVKEGEGTWLSPEEIGGALESLGHSFERNEQFDLALPLFYRALSLCQDQCHMAVLMNNLAVAFAQHPPKAPFETVDSIFPGEKNTSSPLWDNPDRTWTRKGLLDSAERWAKNALKHAKEATGDKRTPECDEACAVALVSLGDIASLAGDFQKARARYERAIEVSQKNDFAEGVAQAKTGLKKLEQ